MAAGPTGVLAHRARLRRYSSFVSRHTSIAGHPLHPGAMGPGLSRQTRHAMTRHALRTTLHEQRDTVIQFTGLNGNACRSGRSSYHTEL
jgi:hypothetical protein